MYIKTVNSVNDNIKDPVFNVLIKDTFNMYDLDFSCTLVTYRNSYYILLKQSFIEQYYKLYLEPVDKFVTDPEQYNHYLLNEFTTIIVNTLCLISNKMEVKNEIL